MTELKDYSVTKQKGIEVREILEPYVRNWKWFVLTLVLSLSAGVLYLRYAKKIYVSKALVLIKDQDTHSSENMAMFRDLGVISGSGNIENEIQVLKSRKLLSRVIKNLELNISVVRNSKTGLRSQELYKDSPIKCVPVVYDSISFFEKARLYKVEPISRKKFHITNASGLNNTYAFGDTIADGDLRFVLLATEHFQSKYIRNDFEISIYNIKKLISSLQSRLEIELEGKDASVLSISLRGPVVDKNNDIINELIRQHRIATVEDKNEIAKNTSDFINERIKVIAKELASIDEENRDFKAKNKLVDLSSDASMYLEQETETEKAIIETNIQLSLAEYMNEFLSKDPEFGVLLPTNLGLEDATVAQNISEYNKLVLSRNELLKSAGEQNPAVLKIESQLTSIREALKLSLSNVVSTLQLKLNVLEKKEQQYEQKIAGVPDYEMEYKEIVRQQQIKETLYLYLLQKREENEISLAATIGNAKTIDEAYSNGIPESPNRKIIIIASILLGLVLPILFIYLRELFNNKVRTVQDIEKLNLPCLGYIPLSKDHEEIVAFPGSRTPVAESFRMMRTNLNFMIHEESDEGKVVLVTSTQPGEGKTFVSLNLAHSLALTDKKVVLIGLDLRAPKLQQYVQLENSYGVSNYLAMPDLTLEQIKQVSTRNENLTYIVSGSIPPNPSELINKKRMTELFEKLKQEFDYILVDTAPVGAVVDTLILSQHADITVYIARANALDKRRLSIPLELYQEGKLKNMAMVVNGVKDSASKFSYGYGYGYTDKPTKRTWFRKKA